MKFFRYVINFRNNNNGIKLFDFFLFTNQNEYITFVWLAASVSICMFDIVRFLVPLSNSLPQHNRAFFFVLPHEIGHSRSKIIIIIIIIIINDDNFRLHFFVFFNPSSGSLPKS